MLGSSIFATRLCRIGLVLTLLLGGGWLAPAPAKAESLKDALDHELEALAKELKEFITVKKGFKTVAIGAFTSSAGIEGNSGPEVQVKLSKVLQKEGVAIATTDFQVELQGMLIPQVDKGTSLQGVKLITRVTDATDGTTLSEFARFVFGGEAVPRLLGITVKTNPNADAETRSEAFKKALSKPPAAPEGNQISVGAGARFKVEVHALVNGKYVPLKPEAKKDKGSLPFVDISINTVYAVKLINEADHEAAVRLTIDGLSNFSFFEAEQKPEFWIIPPRNSVFIKGWQKSEQTTLEFKVTEFPDSAASKVKLKPSPTIGTIVATYSAAWTKDEDKPFDEVSGRGTGFGNEVKNQIQKVSRFIGNVRETVSVRYLRELPGPN